MKFSVAAIVLATAFGSMAANAQTTTIITEERPAAVIVEPAPSITVTTQERGGFLGTETKSTTTTTGTGAYGDCTSQTVRKQDLLGEKTVSKTNCP